MQKSINPLNIIKKDLKIYVNFIDKCKKKQEEKNNEN